MCGALTLTEAAASFFLAVITTEGVTKRRGRGKQKRRNPPGFQPWWRRACFVRLEMEFRVKCRKKNFFKTDKVLNFTTGSVCTTLVCLHLLVNNCSFYLKLMLFESRPQREGLWNYPSSVKLRVHTMDSCCQQFICICAVR